MPRSNQSRISSKKQNKNIGEPDSFHDDNTDVSENPLQFIVPTEVVDLPSKGRFYPPSHPLYNVESIEIRHMTAKEEDLLTSTTLLRKGTALDKVVQNVIVDKRVLVDDLLLGDKNSIIIHSRIFGYGNEFTTSLTCPKCSAPFTNVFDLEEVKAKDYERELIKYDIELTESNTFTMVLPRSQAIVEFRLLTTRDEKKLLGKGKNIGSIQLLEAIVVSLNNQTDDFYIKRAIAHLPIMDATVLKRVYSKIIPDLDMTQEVECPECGNNSEMGVPLDANFFWPDF